MALSKLSGDETGVVFLHLSSAYPLDPRFALLARVAPWASLGGVSRQVEQLRRSACLLSVCRERPNTAGAREAHHQAAIR